MAEGAAAGDGGPAGARWVDVAPDRLARWVASFAERHGAVGVRAGRGRGQGHRNPVLDIG